MTDPVAVYAVVPERRGLGRASARLRGPSRGARRRIAIVLVIAVVGVGAFAAIALRPRHGPPAGGLEDRAGHAAHRAGRLPRYARSERGHAGDRRRERRGRDRRRPAVGRRDDDGGTRPIVRIPPGRRECHGDGRRPMPSPWSGPGLGRRDNGDPDHEPRPGSSSAAPRTRIQGLTKPRDGALDLRSAIPDRHQLHPDGAVRRHPGPALASFVFTRPGRAGDARHRRRATQGRQIADDFSAAYTKLGGDRRPHRALNKGADPAIGPRPAVRPDGAPAAVVLRRLHRHGSPRDPGRRWWRAATARSRS